MYTLKKTLYTPRHDFAHTFIQEHLEKSVEDYIHTDDEGYSWKGVELEKGRHQEELKLSLYYLNFVQWDYIHISIMSFI